MGLCLVIFTPGSSLGFATDRPGQAASLQLSLALSCAASWLWLHIPTPLNTHCKPQHWPVKQITVIHDALPWSLPSCRRFPAHKHRSIPFAFPLKRELTIQQVQDLMLGDCTIFVDLNLSFSPHTLCINVCCCVKTNFVWYLLRGEVGSHLDVAAKRQAHQCHRINNSGHK